MHNTSANWTYYIQKCTTLIHYFKSNFNSEKRRFLCAPRDLCAVIRSLNERTVEVADQVVCIFVVYFIPADENQVPCERLVQFKENILYTYLSCIIYGSQASEKLNPFRNILRSFKWIQRQLLGPGNYQIVEIMCIILSYFISKTL